ncbi:hypothetical protein ACIBJF_39205 [Streptomyces sp. NPDC050743]
MSAELSVALPAQAARAVAEQVPPGMVWSSSTVTVFGFELRTVAQL